MARIFSLKSRTPLYCSMLFILLLCLSHCAVKKGELRTQRGIRTINPTETYLIMKGTSETPLQLVLNDTPAGDSFLRTPALLVNPADPTVARLAERMLATVKKEKGAGIAAPQVGINRSVILVKRLDRKPEKPFVAYKNPEIIDFSPETVVYWDGCLSIPAGFGKVERAASIVIAYDGEDNVRVTERVHGLTARIFQHEIDHLKGILFIDHMAAGSRGLMPIDCSG